MIKKIVLILILIYSFVGWIFINFIIPTNAEWDFTKTDFMINVGDLSPSETKYSDWPKWNINNLLSKISQILLVLIPALAVLFMVVWWIKMITAGWDSSKVSSAKNIITYNIIAVVIALLSYAIIQLIVWLLWSTV